MSDDTDGGPCQSQIAREGFCCQKSLCFLQTEYYFCLQIYMKGHDCVFLREDAVMSFCAFQILSEL